MHLDIIKNGKISQRYLYKYSSNILTYIQIYIFLYVIYILYVIKRQSMVFKTI